MSDTAAAIRYHRQAIAERLVEIFRLFPANDIDEHYLPVVKTMILEDIDAAAKNPRPDDKSVFNPSPRTPKRPRVMFEDRTTTPKTPKLAGEENIEWLDVLLGDPSKGTPTPTKRMSALSLRPAKETDTADTASPPKKQKVQVLNRPITRSQEKTKV